MSNIVRYPGGPPPWATTSDPVATRAQRAREVHVMRRVAEPKCWRNENFAGKAGFNLARYMSHDLSVGSYREVRTVLFNASERDYYRAY